MNFRKHANFWKNEIKFPQSDFNPGSGPNLTHLLMQCVLLTRFHPFDFKFWCNWTISGFFGFFRCKWSPKFWRENFEFDFSSTFWVKIFNHFEVENFDSYFQLYLKSICSQKKFQKTTISEPKLRCCWTHAPDLSLIIPQWLIIENDRTFEPNTNIDCFTSRV